ncbi:serine/threonine protein kinase [Amycolatopsis sp. NBC_00355]|uniref:serine/threonine protein kinase n=1 Tax=Amycolatopsis sp. NBC_00355 TaxID=2975957 RepID=UPI002E25A246
MGTSDPAKVGPYRTIAELGQGGMGRVLLCAAPDGRLVALKQVHSRFVQDDEYRSRFRREVAASRKVSGAYTAAVIDADVDVQAPYLVSVFVPGPSLRAMVDAIGPLPEESTFRLAAGLAAALIEIHRVGLIHRDLKPTNVLLAADGPRVIDFGIARAADGNGSTLTGSGQVVGSPGYMSPEQVMGQPTTPASDVFCLGAVLFLACTGHDPFSGASALQTLYNVVHSEPDLSAIPLRLREVVRRCLDKDPVQRPTAARLLTLIGEVLPSESAWPPAMHELVTRQQADLRRLLTGAGDGHTLLENVPLPLASTLQTASPAATPASRGRPGRRRWPIAAGGVAAVAILVAAVILGYSYGGTTDPAAAGPRNTAGTTPPPASGRSTETPPAASKSIFATSLWAGELPPGYTLCAPEGQNCSPSGTQVIAFGAGTYSYQVITGPALCSSATFGGRDPAPGILKSCYLAPLGGPGGYTSCATDKATCTVDGTREVAFGANGAFRFKTITGETDCIATAFGGDPLVGVPKNCYTAPNGPPGTWIQCASQNGSCAVTGAQPVAYGANGAYAFGTSNGATVCDVSTFGNDPIYGTEKQCYSRTGPPAGFPVECAEETKNCSFANEQTVAFGANGTYLYRTFSGGTPCMASVFGADPLANVPKFCYLTH